MMNGQFLFSIVLSGFLGIAHAAPSSDSLLASAERTYLKADAKAESGHSEEAKRLFQSTLEILDKLRIQEPGRIDADGLRAQTLLMEASVTVDLQQKAAAKVLFEKAINVCDDLIRRDPKNTRWVQVRQVARDTLRNIDSFDRKKIGTSTPRSYFLGNDCHCGATGSN